MREIVQIVRFHLISNATNFRTIESLLNNPNYNPLLKKCVNTLKLYPDACISLCDMYCDDIDNGKFKFRSGTWAMDVQEEDLPKGMILDYNALKHCFREIKTWININKKSFIDEQKQLETKRYS